jgi:hypothetical protein
MDAGASRNRRLKGGIGFVRLLDEAGDEVRDPFLPLDAEFWNRDRTRFTVFFDPGRQKRGILPNEEMGRSRSPAAAAARSRASRASRRTRPAGCSLRRGVAERRLLPAGADHPQRHGRQPHRPRLRGRRVLARGRVTEAGNGSGPISCRVTETANAAGVDGSTRSHGDTERHGQDGECDRPAAGR